MKKKGLRFSFWDSSALVKLFFDEEPQGQCDFCRDYYNKLEITVSIIAYVELRSAIARRSKQNPENQSKIDNIRQELDKFWFNQSLSIVHINDDMLRLAGDYADRFSLRAYDSIQLAAAYTIYKEVNGHVIFFCFDKELSKAGGEVGLIPCQNLVKIW